MPGMCKYGSTTRPPAKQWELQRDRLKPPADMQKVETSTQELSLTNEPVHSTQSTINMQILDTGTTLEVTPIPPNVPNIYPLPDQTPTTLMERMYQLAEVTWSTSDPLSLGAPHDLFDPFTLLYNKNLNSQIITFFSFFRADIELHFRLNTNQFYSGLLAICSYPGAPTARCASFLSARMWCAPKLISAQSQDTLIIRLPWVDPHRFGPVPPQTYMWSVMVNVIAPLRVAAANAPDTILMNIQGRFINPQLVAPFDLSDDQVRKQSSHNVWDHAKKLEKARVRRVQVHKVVRKADPVQSAQTIGKAVGMLLPESVTSTIEHGANLVMELITKIQPAAQAALALAALFDKPNMTQLTTRTLTQPGSNMPRCDEPDQAMPLTLYKTSYLGSDPGILPGGRAWTFREMAMTPMLYGMVAFTSTDTVYDIFLQPPGGSPWLVASALHAYSRASTRIRVDFVCSTFLSARFLFTYTPAYPVISPTQEIDNNVVQLVDVKGNTSVQFTVPFVCPFDMVNRYGAPWGHVYLTLYDAIASIDTVADPTIDVVVWISAAPDVQFSSFGNPGAGSENLWQGAAYDPTSVVRQCDIVEEFKYEFPPFVEGCSYMADNHYVTSETTEYVTDVLKRYCTYLPSQRPSALAANQFPLEYTPLQNCAQWLVKNCFAFHRGGVSYKAIIPKFPLVAVSTPGVTTSGSFTVRYDELSMGANENFDGSAAIIQADSSDQIDFSVPWLWNLPYYQLTPGSLPSQPNAQDLMYGSTPYSNLGQVQAATLTYSSAGTPYYYTAVRDDYSVGFLQQPPLTPALVSKEKKKPLQTDRLLAARFREKAQRKLSAESFVPLKKGFFGTPPGGKQPSK